MHCFGAIAAPAKVSVHFSHAFHNVAVGKQLSGLAHRRGLSIVRVPQYFLVMKFPRHSVGELRIPPMTAACGAGVAWRGTERLAAAV